MTNAPSALALNPQPKLGWWTLTLVSLAWLTTVGLGAIATLRIFYHDGTHVLTWLNAFTRYVYLPAYACWALAWWKRRYWLAIVNLLIIGCHLYWLAPDFLPWRWLNSPAPVASTNDQGNHTIRIFFANVRVQNTEYEAMLQEIKAANPDLIVLVEFSHDWREAFRKSPVLAAYPYGSGLQHARIDGVHIMSKLPIQSDTQEWIADRCVETVNIPLGSQTLRLTGLHAPRPMDYRNNDYDGYWRHGIPLLLGQRHPLVVIGDCNATQYSSVYKRIEAGGLRSAHEDRGRGYATSWPNEQNWLAPIRIDQAFLSPDVTCLNIEEGVGLGSDHKPLILDIQIHDPPVLHEK